MTYGTPNDPDRGNYPVERRPIPGSDAERLSREFNRESALDDLAIDDLRRRWSFGVGITALGLLLAFAALALAESDSLSGVNDRFVGLLLGLAVPFAIYGPEVVSQVSLQRRILKSSAWVRVPAHLRYARIGLRSERLLLIPSRSDPYGQVFHLRIDTKRRLVNSGLSRTPEVDVAGRVNRGLVVRVPGDSALFLFVPAKNIKQENRWRSYLRLPARS